MSDRNRIVLKIEADGGIKVSTDSFEDGIVHTQADKIVKEVAKLTGGPVKVVKKSDHGHDNHGHVHIDDTVKH